MEAWSPLQWNHGVFLTTGLPGKSLIIIIIFTMLILHSPLQWKHGVFLTTGLPGKSVIIIIIIFTVLILLRLTYCMYYFDSLDSSLTQLVNVEYQD